MPAHARARWTGRTLKAKRSALIGDVPRHSLRVVGLAVTQNEFEAGNGSRYDLFTTRAFAAAVNRRAVVLPVFYVGLRHGAADLPVEVRQHARSGARACCRTSSGGRPPHQGRGGPRSLTGAARQPPHSPRTRPA
jgi:hypothetical protein